MTFNSISIQDSLDPCFVRHGQGHFRPKLAQLDLATFNLHMKPVLILDRADCWRPFQYDTLHLQSLLTCCHGKWRVAVI